MNTLIPNIIKKNEFKFSEFRKFKDFSFRKKAKEYLSVL